MGARRTSEHTILLLPIFMVTCFVVMIAALLIKEANTPIEAKRYTLLYNGQTVKCKVQFPHYADGKMSRWSGTVNLTQCEDGKDYLGATNVQVVSYPECGCGG